MVPAPVDSIRGRILFFNISEVLKNKIRPPLRTACGARGSVGAVAGSRDRSDQYRRHRRHGPGCLRSPASGRHGYCHPCRHRRRRRASDRRRGPTPAAGTAHRDVEGRGTPRRTGPSGPADRPGGGPSRHPRICTGCSRASANRSSTCSIATNFDLPNRIFGNSNFGRIFSAKNPRECSSDFACRFEVQLADR